MEVSPTSGCKPLDVTASANLENTGNATGEYNVTFRIDGAVIDYITGTLGAGNSTIISFDHKFENAGTYNVTIDDLPAVEVSVSTVETVSVTPSTKELYVGESFEFTAEATWTNGTKMDVSNAANWLVSNNTVGNIDEGIFTASSAGNTTIAAVYEGITSSAEVTVSLLEITIHKPESITYATKDIQLNITSNKDMDTWKYNLNNEGNNTFEPNITITAKEGNNSLIVYAEKRGITLMAEISFIVDTTPPELMFVGPIPGNNSLTVSTWLSVNITSDEPLSNATLQWTNCSLPLSDSCFIRSVSMNGSDTTWYLNVTGLNDSSYSFRVLANDTAGNHNETRWKTFTIDTTPPILSEPSIDPPNPVVKRIDGNLTVAIINASVSATDDYLSQFTVNVSFLNGTVIYTQDMMNKESFAFNITHYGTYVILATAGDLVGNENSISKEFGVALTDSSTKTIKNGTEEELLNNSQVSVKATANESANVSVSLNTTVSPSPEFGLPSIDRSNAGMDTGVKYLNVSSADDRKNITKYTLEMRYTNEEIRELDENSLAIFYFNGTKWINCNKYKNDTLPSGPFVFDAGNNPGKNYVYAVVNHTSDYGLGGNYSVPEPVEDLAVSSKDKNWIEWAWKNPSIPDLNHTVVYIDGEFAANLSAGVESYKADGFDPGTKHIISIRVVDSTQLLSSWTNLSVNTESEPSPPSGGGGGGGGGMPPAPSLVAPSEFSESIVKRFSSGEEIVIGMPSNIVAMGITEIGAVYDQSSNLRVTVSKALIPSDVRKPKGNVYTYFEVLFTDYFTSVKVEPTGYINFKLVKSDLNRADESDVQFLKWTGSKWNELSSEFVDEDEEYYYFRVNLDSFSLFAVTIQKEETAPSIPSIPSTPIPTKTPVVTPTISTTSPTPSITPTPLWKSTEVIIVIAVILAAIAVLGYVAWRIK